MLRSATFTIGILLAGLAFVGFLMLGGMMAPPPYSVVIAVQDISAYSTLDPNALGVDAQRINSQVAQTFILREEIDQYVGGFVLENIHAGEPLRKSAIVAPGNPQAINRLALVMTDPDKVAMVVPVDPKTAPSQIAPGDWVDLVVGLAPGNISAGSNSTFSNLLAPPTVVSPIVSFGPTPASGARPAPTLPPNPSPLNPPTNPGSLSANDMNLPADKVVIQNVPVLAVRFQQVPNPAFTGSGAGFGQSQQSQTAAQPAYIQGDIQTITVLVPRASVELLTFGKDNGRVHVVLLPAKTAEAAQGAQAPTFGITFNDVLAWMMRERTLVASGQGQPVVAQPTQSAPPLQPTPLPGVGQPTQPAQPTAQPSRAPVSPPKPTPATPAAIPTGLDIGALLVPLLCGVVLLFIFVAVVRFIRKRRRDSGLV
jgi:Flp pilus assembly protein CpaB